MQISRTPINASIPATSQQQTDLGRLLGVQKINPERDAEQQRRPDHSAQQRQYTHALTANEIASAVQQIKAGQRIPTDRNTFDAAGNTRMQKAIDAYTEELYQPVQEQLSILAGIDFYI